MTTNFGPWTTAIHDHGKAQLATFWKHRFKALASADASRPANRLSSFVVVAVAILGLGLPTLLAEPATPPTRPATAIPGATPDEQDAPLKTFIAKRAERLKLLARNADPIIPKRLRPDINRKHSVDFTFGQPIRSAFEFLSDLYRVWIVLPPGDLPERRLTFKFTDKTLSEALDIFCEHADWEWDTDGYVIYSGPERAVNEFRRLAAARDERRRNYPAGLARGLQDRMEAEFIRQDLGRGIRMLSTVTTIPMRVGDAKLATEQVSFSMAKVRSLPLDIFLDLLSLKYNLRWDIDDTGTIVIERKPDEQARLQNSPDDIVFEEKALPIEDVILPIEDLIVPIEDLIVPIEAEILPVEFLTTEEILPVEVEPLNGGPIDPIVPIEEQPFPILRRFEHATDHPAAIT